MSAQVINPINLAARSASGMTLAGLKPSVNLAARSFHSKYRHKGKFSNSLGHGVIYRGVPLWASILITIAIVLAALFIVALITFGVKGKQYQLLVSSSI